MQSWFAEEAIAPNRINYCNSLSTMLSVVRAGICICMMPLELVGFDIEAGTLRSLIAEPPLRPLTFFVATRAETIDPAVADIAELVATVVRLPRMDKATGQLPRTRLQPESNRLEGFRFVALRSPRGALVQRLDRCRSANSPKNYRHPQKRPV